MVAILAVYKGKTVLDKIHEGILREFEREESNLLKGFTTDDLLKAVDNLQRDKTIGSFAVPQKLPKILVSEDIARGLQSAIEKPNESNIPPDAIAYFPYMPLHVTSRLPDGTVAVVENDPVENYLATAFNDAPGMAMPLGSQVSEPDS